MRKRVNLLFLVFLCVGLIMQSSCNSGKIQNEASSSQTSDDDSTILSSCISESSETVSSESPISSISPDSLKAPVSSAAPVSSKPPVTSKITTQPVSSNPPVSSESFHTPSDINMELFTILLGSSWKGDVPGMPYGAILTFCPPTVVFGTIFGAVAKGTCSVNKNVITLSIPSLSNKNDSMTVTGYNANDGTLTCIDSDDNSVVTLTRYYSFFIDPNMTPNINDTNYTKSLLPLGEWKEAVPGTSDYITYGFHKAGDVFITVNGSLATGTYSVDKNVITYSVPSLNLANITYTITGIDVINGILTLTDSTNNQTAWTFYK